MSSPATVGVGTVESRLSVFLLLSEPEVPSLYLSTPSVALPTVPTVSAPENYVLNVFARISLQPVLRTPRLTRHQSGSWKWSPDVLGDSGVAGGHRYLVAGEASLFRNVYSTWTGTRAVSRSLY